MPKKRKLLRGTVAKVIKSTDASQPEKAEIDIHEAKICTGEFVSIMK